MAEPASTGVVAVAATGVTLAGLLPGIDGNALIGAFAGASLFVVSRREGGALSRLAYWAISVVIGYLAAPDVVALTPIKETAIAAFAAAALVVTVALTAIEKVKSLDFSVFRKGG
ncbi:putative holin [Achromobacter xylosoxidans]